MWFEDLKLERLCVHHSAHFLSPLYLLRPQVGTCQFSYCHELSPFYGNAVIVGSLRFLDVFFLFHRGSGCAQRFISGLVLRSGSPAIDPQLF